MMRGKQPTRACKSSRAPRRSAMSAACTFTASKSPCVSTRMCRLRPMIFFPRVVATLEASDWTGFDRLTVDDGRAWLRVAAHLRSDFFAQAAHGLFPGPIKRPFSEVVVDRFAIGQIVRHLSPRAACAQQILNAVDDL